MSQSHVAWTQHKQKLGAASRLLCLRGGRKASMAAEDLCCQHPGGPWPPGGAAQVAPPDGWAPPALGLNLSLLHPGFFLLSSDVDGCTPRGFPVVVGSFP